MEQQHSQRQKSSVLFYATEEVIKYCEMLNINPNELVPRTFESFAEEGLPHSIQRLRHDHYEKKRTARLFLIQKLKRRNPGARGYALNDSS